MFVRGGFEFAFFLENRIGDGIAHFVEIFFRHIADRVGVRFSLRGKFVENLFPICAVFFDYRIKHAAVFKRAVHSLTVKRHHRVRRIAEQ